MIFIYFLKALARVVSFRYIYKIDLLDFNISTQKKFKFQKGGIQEINRMYNDHQDEISSSRYNDLKNILNSENSEIYTTKNYGDLICGYSILEYGYIKESSYLTKIKGIDIEKNGYVRRDYTFINFRGQGLHKYSIVKRLQILKEKSFRTCTTRIAVQNVISKNNYQTLGFEKYLLEIEFHFFHKLRNNNKIFFSFIKNR
jgi:hypothetical protein